jgi:hypothetical protein
LLTPDSRPVWNEFENFGILGQSLWGPAIQWRQVIQKLFNEEVALFPDGSGSVFAGGDGMMPLARKFVIGGSANLPNMNCDAATFSDPTQVRLIFHSSEV